MNKKGAGPIRVTIPTSNCYPHITYKHIRKLGWTRTTSNADTRLGRASQVLVPWLSTWYLEISG